MRIACLHCAVPACTVHQAGTQMELICQRLAATLAAASALLLPVHAALPICSACDPGVLGCLADQHVLPPRHAWSPAARSNAPSPTALRTTRPRPCGTDTSRLSGSTARRQRWLRCMRVRCSVPWRVWIAWMQRECACACPVRGCVSTPCVCFDSLLGERLAGLACVKLNGLQAAVIRGTLLLRKHSSVPQDLQTSCGSKTACA